VKVPPRIDLGTPVVEAIGAGARSKFNGHIPRVTIELRGTSAKTEEVAREALQELARKRQ
jgi:arylsulfatase